MGAGRARGRGQRPPECAAHPLAIRALGMAEPTTRLEHPSRAPVAHRNVLVDMVCGLACVCQHVAVWRVRVDCRARCCCRLRRPSDLDLDRSAVSVAVRGRRRRGCAQCANGNAECGSAPAARAGPTVGLAPARCGGVPVRRGFYCCVLLLASRLSSCGVRSAVDPC